MTTQHTPKQIIKILADHKKWLADDGGNRANLPGANLTDADLTYANLTYANLTYANLTYADLAYADLTGANMYGANLAYADLTGANMYGADLAGANLAYADLTGAIGSNSRMQSLQIDPYKIIVLDKMVVWGGCTKKTAQEWLDYEGIELSKTNRKYLNEITKPFIRMCIGASA